MDCSLPGFTSNGFSRQEYWSGLPFPSPGDLPVPEIKFTPPALQAYYLLLSPQGSPVDRLIHVKCVLCSHLVDVVCSHLIANIFVNSFFFFFFLPISLDAAHLQYDRSIAILRRAQVYAHMPSIYLYTLIDR